MQAVIITRNVLLSEQVTREMLTEIAMTMFNKSAAWVQEVSESPLKKGSATIKALSHAKLRTTLDQLLTQSPAEEYGDLYAKGELVVEFTCLADLDIGNAGKNKARTGKAGGAKAAGGAKVGSATKRGAYKIVRRPDSASVNGGDAGKWEIWMHVWACTSFEEFFAKCPKKAVTATGRVISASTEINWALKAGWIQPVVETQAASQPAEETQAEETQAEETQAA